MTCNSMQQTVSVSGAVNFEELNGFEYTEVFITVAVLNWKRTRMHSQNTVPMIYYLYLCDTLHRSACFDLYRC